MRRYPFGAVDALEKKLLLLLVDEVLDDPYAPKGQRLTTGLARALGVQMLGLTVQKLADGRGVLFDDSKRLGTLDAKDKDAELVKTDLLGLLALHKLGRANGALSDTFANALGLFGHCLGLEKKNLSEWSVSWSATEFSDIWSHSNAGCGHERRTRRVVGAAFDLFEH